MFTASQEGQQPPLQDDRTATLQLQNCYYEIDTLKQHIQGLEEQNNHLQSEISHLKMELKASLGQNNTLFQENERNKQLVDRIKLENKSKEMEIDNFRKERRFYNRDVSSIQALKHDLTDKIKERNQTIEDLGAQIRALQRQNSDFQNRQLQMEKFIQELETERQDLREEVKDQLEKYLSCNGQTERVRRELRETNDLNRSMRERIMELEREKEQFRLQAAADCSEEAISDSRGSHYSPDRQRSMMEVQSYMKGIENVLSLKEDQIERKRKNYDKLAIALESLQGLL